MTRLRPDWDSYGEPDLSVVGRDLSERTLSRLKLQLFWRPKLLPPRVQHGNRIQITNSVRHIPPRWRMPASGFLWFMLLIGHSDSKRQRTNVLSRNAN